MTDDAAEREAKAPDADAAPSAPADGGVAAATSATATGAESAADVAPPPGTQSLQVTGWAVPGADSAPRRPLPGAIGPPAPAMRPGFPPGGQVSGQVMMAPPGRMPPPGPMPPGMAPHGPYRAPFPPPYPVPPPNGAWQGALRPPVFVVNQPSSVVERPTYREPFPIRAGGVTAGLGLGALWMALFAGQVSTARSYAWVTIVAAVLAWIAAAVLTRFGDRGVAVGVAISSGIGLAIAGLVVALRLYQGDWLLW